MSDDTSRFLLDILRSPPTTSSPPSSVSVDDTTEKLRQILLFGGSGIPQKGAPSSGNEFRKSIPETSDIGLFKTTSSTPRYIPIEDEDTYKKITTPPGSKVSTQPSSTEKPVEREGKKATGVLLKGRH